MILIFILSNHFDHELERHGLSFVNCGGIAGLFPCSKLPFLSKVWLPGFKEQGRGFEGLFSVNPQRFLSSAGFLPAAAGLCGSAPSLHGQRQR